MEKVNALDMIFADGASGVLLSNFVFNLFLAAALSYGVGLIYIKYGAALSNRRAFANNFVLVAVTTMLVISVVQTSLALSLGLIGALSIVRFRAAIKDPEELSYLFLTIAVGLGLGANQRLITIITVGVILAFLMLRRSAKQDLQGHWGQDLYLTVSTNATDVLTLDRVTDVVDANCTQVQMKRSDTSGDLLEAMFLVEFNETASLHAIESSLREIDATVNVTFLDSR